jgi:predicted signal transduction protein with EAL and GGDEF domain
MSSMGSSDFIARIGFAIFPENEATTETLLTTADVEMHMDHPASRKTAYHFSQW